MELDSDALCCWVQNCSSLEKIKTVIKPSIGDGIVGSYFNLCNGVLLNAILNYIFRADPECKFEVPEKNDVSGRIRNLRIFLKNVLIFYCDVLNQIIVMPLPDLLTIARHPFPDGSGEEMKKVLLLLLGCAVQSDKKEEFINKIKELDLPLQQAIVEQIRKVTNDADCVLNVQALELDPNDKATIVVLHQLQRVVKERDLYAQTILEMNQEQESDCSSTQSLCNGDVCSRKLPESQQHVTSINETREHSVEKFHTGVEVAELKAKLRKMQKELDDKNDQLLNCKEELDEKATQLEKLEIEAHNLKQKAREAKESRDENDILREKASKLDRLEMEFEKCKEKLTEMEFLRKLSNELREENSALWQKRHELEDELDELRSKSMEHVTLKSDLMQMRTRAVSYESQLKSEKDKIMTLIEDNAKLKRECQDSLEKSVLLEKEIEFLKNCSLNEENSHFLNNSSLSSLSNQLNESAHSKILKLESENQLLRNQLESNSNLTLLKDENEKLTKKCEHIKEQNEINADLCSQLRDERDLLVKQFSEQDQSFKLAQDHFKRQIDESKNEYKKLNDENATLRAKCSDFQNNEKQKQVFEDELELAKKERDSLKEAQLSQKSDYQTANFEIGRLKNDLARCQTDLNQLEKEKLDSENRIYILERDKNNSEKENNRLKQLLGASESELEKSRCKLTDFELKLQKSENAQEKLHETRRLMTEMEDNSKSLKQQLEDNKQRYTALKKDLDSEMCLRMDVESKINSIYSSFNFPENDWKDGHLLIKKYVEQLKTNLDDYQSKYEQLNFDKNQLLEEIKNKTEDLESAKRKLLDQQNDKDKKMMMKELETKNSMYQEEIKSVRQQVHILEEQIRKMQALIDAGTRQKAVLQQEIKDLQVNMKVNKDANVENNNLLVDLRTLTLQASVLEQDNVELEKQCAQSERDYLAAKRDFEQLQAQHNSLLSDHEQLQNLHEQLGLDFEKLQCELVHTKGQMRQMKHECNEHCNQLDRAKFEIKLLAEQKLRWEQERSEKDREFKTFVVLQNEHSALRKTYEELLAKCQFQSNDLDTARNEYRNLRSDYNNANTRSSQLQMQMADYQALIQRKDLELVKLLHKCDMLTQLNGTLEEESRTLLRQMETLIAQNQDLLTQALLDQKQYHAEEKELQEKLNALKRHKEKLEEKIMEQYKTMDSPSKRKEKTNFIKKARAALTAKPSSRKMKIKGGIESGDENCLSCDEGGFLSSQSAYLADVGTASNRAISADRLRPISRRSQSDLQSSHASSSETLQSSFRSPSNSVCYKRSASAVHQPSVNSGNEHSTDKPQPGAESAPLERISLAGSERAVDVPSRMAVAPGPAPPQKPQPPYPFIQRPLNNCAANYSLPQSTCLQPNHFRSSTAPRVPTSNQTAGNRPTPPPSPMLTRKQSFRKPRPPPPSYSSLILTKGNSYNEKSPIKEEKTELNYQSVGQVGFLGGQNLDFSPPPPLHQTSTPNNSKETIRFNSPVSDFNGSTGGNNACGFEDSRHNSTPQTSSFKKSFSTTNKKSNEVERLLKRKEISSFYENMENLAICDQQPQLDRQLSDSTLTSDVIPDTKQESENTIWYEYGCV